MNEASKEPAWGTIDFVFACKPTASAGVDAGEVCCREVGVDAAITTGDIAFLQEEMLQSKSAWCNE